MIDEKKLEELNGRYRQIKRDEWLELMATFHALWAVVRAAQGLKIGGECWCGVAMGNPHYRGIHSPRCAAMGAAIAPFAASEGTEENR